MNNDQPSFYTIEKQTRFYVTFAEVKALEDCTDEFFSEEEALELVGGGEYGWINVGYPTINKTAVIEALNAIVEDIKSKNKKTGIIADKDLVDVLVETNTSVSTYIPGLRRVGNRLTIHTIKNAKTKANKKDLQRLINIGFTCVGLKYGMSTNPDAKHYDHFYVECKYTYHNYIGALNILKKLLTIDDILKHVDKAEYGDNELDKQYLKEAWEKAEEIVAE